MLTMTYPYIMNQGFFPEGNEHFLLAGVLLICDVSWMVWYVVHGCVKMCCHVINTAHICTLLCSLLVGPGVEPLADKPALKQHRC